MGGTLVLDAHRNAVDIICTAVWARRGYPNHSIYLPVVGYAFYVPLLRQFIGYISRTYRINFIPVYRRAELQPGTVLLRFFSSFYPPELTTQKRMDANQYFIDTCRSALSKTDSIVVVSPYGGPTLYGGKIKYGVRELMGIVPEILITRTHIDLLRLRSRTQYSPYASGIPLQMQYASL